MDTEIIVEAFIVVVIGGLGSFWGTFLGSVIYGQVLSFGILFFPRFSIFSVFALMAAVLDHPPLGPPRPAPEIATGESMTTADRKDKVVGGSGGGAAPLPPVQNSAVP